LNTIRDADESGRDNLHKHSAAILKGVLQTASDAFHLNARFARDSDSHDSSTKLELLPFLKSHHINSIDHDILMNRTGREGEGVHHSAGHQQNLPPFSVGCMAISGKAACNDFHRVQGYGPFAFLSLDE
jgi:hypothetical protein